MISIAWTCIQLMLGNTTVQSETPVIHATVPTLDSQSVTPTTPTGTEMRISPKDGMAMMYVPAGEFQMGSSETDYQYAIDLCVKSGNSQALCENSFSNEKPLHSVYLDAFWIDRTEVTNAMYKKCVTVGECLLPQDTTSINRDAYYDNNQFANYPVIYVDWNQADSYCKWAKRNLPTEAQWEKAARGTDGRIYPWGKGIDCEKTNFWGKDGACVGDTSEVIRYPASASPYGALDMAGNVEEWVADWSGEYSTESQRNPAGNLTGEIKILRGGFWNGSDLDARVMFRDGDLPIDATGEIGFRCSLKIEP